MVVRDRTLSHVDEAEVRAKAREEAARLWARIDDLAAHPFEPAGSS
jgi:hypothetical protein